MKITCLQENLKRGLNIAQNIVGRNLTLPILNNLLIMTDKGRLKISSTNLEIGINVWVSSKVEKEGAITCPARILSGFVNSLPNKKIELEEKNNLLTIRCENYRATIRGLSAEDFPLIPKIKDSILAEIDGQILRKGLEKVVGAVAISELRPEIAGVLFKWGKNSLKLVATDSFRLAEQNISLSSFDALDQSFILPQRTAQELVRILAEGEQVWRIVLGGSQILFDGGETQLISRLLEGQYPDYQQIIPKDHSFQAIADKDELINIIRLAGLFSSKINEARLVFKESKLEVLSQDHDLGENRSYLAVEAKGRPLEASFNYRYVLDGLLNIEGKKVLLGFTSDSAPAILKPVGDESYLYVVMPIKASG